MVGTVMLDTSAAFDAIDRERLKFNLKACGSSSSALTWMDSCLSGEGKECFELEVRSKVMVSHEGSLKDAV